MSFGRLPVLLLVAAAMVCALLLGVQGGSAQELLENGDFEHGVTGWSPRDISATACTPHSGSGAAAVSKNGLLQLQQTVEGPFGGGTHTLTGWLKVDGGSATVAASLTWYNQDGDSVGRSEVSLAPGADYESFSVALPFDSRAATLQVLFKVTLSGDRVCFDDLSVDGPPPATATPPATETPPPTNTSEAAATATGTSTATATATPTVLPSSTATPRPTATSAPTETPSPGLVFVNGDFSDGLYGWQKYGGSLSASGGAGVLSSESASTKWAYETVAVDPGSYYEFSASLKPDDGVASAYLRVSWYAAGDGSGSALDTTDSTEKIAGPSASYQSVTTGAVAPPSSAHSARLRVMLSPAGAGSATLYFDDVSFGVTAAPTATPQPTATPTSTSKAATATATPKPPTRTPAARNSTTARVEKTQQAVAAAKAVAQPDSWDVTATPEGAIKVSAVEAERQAGPPQDDAAPLDVVQPESGSGGGSSVPFVWLIGAGMLVVGLTGAYVQERRRR